MAKIKYIVVAFCLFISSFAYSQITPYKIYTQKGKEVSIEQVVKNVVNADVVLFGEFHNNTINHWLQLQVLKELSKQKSVVFGLEMFERDQQEVINQYLDNIINEKQLDTLTRFWGNYKTDYKPMVTYAQMNQIPIIATNVPRKYASLLFKNGEKALMDLPSEEKQFIAPLPFPYDAELPAYKAMLDMFSDASHANENFPKAQAIKDATMAYSIIENLNKGDVFFHINGSYHSNNYEGIVWYLKEYKKGLKIKTLTVVEVDDVHDVKKDDLKLADYIIYLPNDIIKSYE